jgi:hypothetical protein
MSDNTNCKGAFRAFYDGEIEIPTRPARVCVSPLATRPVLYTDTVGGVQTCRDDLWAITTDELNALAAPDALAAVEHHTYGSIAERMTGKHRDDSGTVYVTLADAEAAVRAVASTSTAWRQTAETKDRQAAEVRAHLQQTRMALRWALEWIDAVPGDTPLPTMPGFDRDYVNVLLDTPTTSARPAIGTEEQADAMLADLTREYHQRAAPILKILTTFAALRPPPPMLISREHAERLGFTPSNLPGEPE